MERLAYKTTVVWASLQDMVGGAEFAKERQDMINALRTFNVTDGVVSRNDANFSASISFVDESSARDWLNFITNLAIKYSKNIVSKTIEAI